jgi:hypothetical protein
MYVYMCISLIESELIGRTACGSKLVFGGDRSHI